MHFVGPSDQACAGLIAPGGASPPQRHGNHHRRRVEPYLQLQRVCPRLGPRTALARMNLSQTGRFLLNLVTLKARRMQKPGAICLCPMSLRNFSKRPPVHKSHKAICVLFPCPVRSTASRLPDGLFDSRLRRPQRCNPSDQRPEPNHHLSKAQAEPCI